MTPRFVFVRLTFLASLRSFRGIGCEIVRQLSLKPHALVVAGARDPTASPELMEIVKQSAGRVVPLVLDISSQASIDVRPSHLLLFHKDRTSH